MLFLAAALAIAAVITRIAGHSRQTEGNDAGLTRETHSFLIPPARV